MFGAKAITWLSGFVLLLFLPRYLGSARYGQLYLAISIGMILSIVIDFGGNFLIPKEVARDKEKTPHILMSFLGFRTIIWASCMGVLVLFAFLVDYSPTVKWLIFILGISKLWEGGVKAIRSCFQGHEMMEYPSMGMIAQKVFVAAAAVAALFLGAGPITIAIIMAAGVLVNLAACLKFVPNIIDAFPGFQFEVPWSLVKTSLPYFLWSIFGVIYYRIDTVMLSMFTSESVVGWYGGAYRFFDVIMFLPSIFTTVIFPIFSKLKSEQEELSDTFQRSLKYMMLCGVAMATCYFLFAEDIVRLFYGLDEYGPSVLLLQIFAPGVILVYIDFIMGSTIMATDKQRTLAWVGLIAILLNVGLNYVGIPYAQMMWDNGGIGAALTTIVTELFIMASVFGLLPGKYFRGFRISLPARCILSGMVMFGSIWVLDSLQIYWMLQAILGLLVYLGCSVLFDVITPKERRFFKEFFYEYQPFAILKPNQEQI